MRNVSSMWREIKRDRLRMAISVCITHGTTVGYNCTWGRQVRKRVSYTQSGHLRKIIAGFAEKNKEESV